MSPPFKSSALSEVVLLLCLFIITLTLMIYFDLFEKVINYLSREDQYELDEIIFASAVFSVFTSIYAIRRWQESFILYKSQQRSTAELQEANSYLENITNELYNKQDISSQLSRLANYLQACRTKDEAFGFIQISAEKLFVDSSGAIFITENSSDRLVQAVRWGEASFPPFFLPESCWSLRLGKPFTVNPKTAPLSCRHIPARDASIHSCHPLLAYGELIGLLHITVPKKYWNEQQEKIDLNTELTLSMFKEQISLALSNIDLHMKLSHMAVHDALTGLYNRHYLEETIDRELYRAERHQAKLGIIMMDLDHFKNLNDTYGHTAGDTVLAEVGKFITTYSRAGDFCCRYGGEEFMLILTDIHKEGFIKKCESLRASIEDLTIICGDLSLKITVTVGASIFPDHGKTRQQIVDAADKALYMGKKLGRNRFYLVENK